MQDIIAFCLRNGKCRVSSTAPFSPEVLRGSTCYRFCSCTSISTQVSTNAELCWWQQCLALCAPAPYQYKVIAESPDQSVGLPHCVPTNDSSGTTWERAEEMARKFLMFSLEFVLLCWVQVPWSGWPCAGHSWFQAALQWTQHRTQLSISVKLGHLCGGVCKEGKMLHGREEWGRRWKSSQHREKKEREELLQKQVCSLQTTEDYMPEQVQIFLKELQSMERTMPEQVSAEGLLPVERTMMEQ